VHRSRLSVLVIVAAGAAACSTHDDTDGTAILSQDRTLVKALQNDQQTRPSALPDACTSVTVATQPASNRPEAEVLTRRAYDAEMQGNVQEARSLLQRASRLDGTNKSAAYHLGLTSETLGDRATAVAAYCRYLTLAPTSAESAEARQRVARLSQGETRMSAGSVSDSTGSQRVVRAQPMTRAQGASARVASTSVATAPVTRSARVASARRSTRPAMPVARGNTVESSARAEPMITSREVEPSTNATAGGDVVAASTPVSTPAADATPEAPRTIRRGPTRAQGAGVGAMAGAILGAATGRSVKSAVIGAAAGGLLGGTIVGRGPSFVGRGIAP
jgi:hypothetical protein